MGKLIDETDLMNLLYALDDARHELCYAIKKIPELPEVDAIPRDQYEARLKADMVAMLTEILTDFDNQIEPNSTRIDCESIIEQKIQALEGKTDGEK